MGGLTRAMAASARSSGVSIRTSAKVKKVIIREGKAIGVELEDGEQIESAIVVSNADPFQTFRHLVGLENLDSAFSDALSKAKTDLTHLKFHCALREAPDFSRHFPDQESNKYMGMMDICPSPEYFQNSCRDTAEGASPILLFSSFKFLLYSTTPLHRMATIYSRPSSCMPPVCWPLGPGTTPGRRPPRS